MWRHLDWIGKAQRVELRHYKNGPTLSVNCHPFNASSPDQTTLFWKGTNGWRQIETTAFGLADPEFDLSDYVSRHAPLDCEGSCFWRYMQALAQSDHEVGRWSRHKPF